MGRVLIYAFAVMLMVPCARPARAFTVRMDRDTLTVSADRVPLQVILKRLAEAGVKVHIDPRINPPVSASFTGRKIHKAFESLLKDLDYAMVWDTVVESGIRYPRLVEVQVFEPGRKDRMKSLAPSRSIAVTRNPKDGSLFVKDELLLRLVPGMDLDTLRGLLEEFGGTVIGSDTPLGIVRVRLAPGSDVPALARRLAGNSGISEAEPDYVYPMPPPLSLETPPVSPAREHAGRAEVSTVAVAVLDSGLTTAGLAMEGLVAASFEALNPGDPITDTLGHGTQMALIASGVVSPDGVKGAAEDAVPIIAVKVFDDNGFTSTSAVARAVEFALDRGARVLSLSWGSETRSGFLEYACDYARSRGAVVVASAGNEPSGTPVYPAAFESVIGVGALSPGGGTWEKSNYGEFVSLYAPGFAVFPVGYKGAPGTYAGTSISAAFAARHIAVRLTADPAADGSLVLTSPDLKPAGTQDAP